MKKLIKNKSILLGTWLTLPSPSIAEMACRSGFDWMAIDLEHSMMTTDQAQELIRTIDLMGKIPFVRLSSNDEVLIKRVMDAGAHGIVVPMVNTLKDVEYAYKAMHYPPSGIRGVGLARAQAFGANFRGYWDWLKENGTLIVQIEHKNALDNLDAIFSSGLIDGYIIGPYDLSASLGIPGEFENPILHDALRKIEIAADKHGVAKGIHIVEMDEKALAERIQSGYRIIAYGVDFRVLESNYTKATHLFNDLKKRL
jgi:2-keto-3-deoxy-L-rhamnonate aldolase RhmA